MKLLYTLLIGISTLGIYAQKAVSIKPYKKIDLKISEPSDICLSANGKSFYIVSDNGLLFETDLEGNIIRKADYNGIDTEAVYANEHFVYVVEEFSRKIKVLDVNNLNLKQTVYLPYNGGRNKSYEAMTYNASKKCFVLLTEKDPIYLFELDNDLEIINQINISHIARDISAATFHDDFLWLLSDEDRTVLKLDPLTYKVKSKYIIPIINPEGLTFDKNGNMIVVSDDMEQMYYFKNPEAN